MMKRMITVILVTAILLSVLSTSVFATTNVNITFTAPKVNDNIPVHGTPVAASDGYSGNVQGVYTGSAITEIQTAIAANNTSALQAYTAPTDPPTEKYSSQEYLIVISLYSATPPAETPQLTVSDNTVTCGTLYSTAMGTGYMLYAYLRFTPTQTLNNTKDVLVTYDNSNVHEPTISVSIMWGALKFTYDPGTKGTWDSENHRYNNDGETPSWTPEGNAITVTNHSDTAITAIFEYEKAPGYNDISATFLDENDAPCVDGRVSIATAVDTNPNEAPKKTVYLVLDGTLTNTSADESVSGTVTITID